MERPISGVLPCPWCPITPPRLGVAYLPDGGTICDHRRRQSGWSSGRPSSLAHSLTIASRNSWCCWSSVLASITKAEYTRIVVGETIAVLTVPPITALIWRAARWRNGRTLPKGTSSIMAEPPTQHGLDQPGQDLVLAVSCWRRLEPSLHHPPTRPTESVAVGAQHVEIDADAQRCRVASAQRHHRHSRHLSPRPFAGEMQAAAVIVGGAAHGDQPGRPHHQRPTPLSHEQAP